MADCSLWLVSEYSLHCYNLVIAQHLQNKIKVVCRVIMKWFLCLILQQSYNRNFSNDETFWRIIYTKSYCRYRDILMLEMELRNAVFVIAANVCVSLLMSFSELVFANTADFWTGLWFIDCADIMRNCFAMLMQPNDYKLLTQCCRSEMQNCFASFLFWQNNN